MPFDDPFLLIKQVGYMVYVSWSCKCQWRAFMQFTMYLIDNPASVTNWLVSILNSHKVLSVPLKVVFFCKGDIKGDATLFRMLSLLSPVEHALHRLDNQASASSF